MKFIFMFCFWKLIICICSFSSNTAFLASETMAKIQALRLWIQGYCCESGPEEAHLEIQRKSYWWIKLLKIPNKKVYFPLTNFVYNERKSYNSRGACALLIGRLDLRIPIKRKNGRWCQSKLWHFYFSNAVI